MTPGRIAHRATVAVMALALSMPMLGTAPASADDAPGKNCPDIHVLAVEGTDQPTVNAPTGNDTGELAGVIVPVVNAANKNGYKLERTYITYPADGGSGLTAAYKTSVLDGYHRLADVAARVVYQCPATKLVVLGYGQGAHAVSMWAQQVATGKTEHITPDQVALVTTFGDPTRAADAPLFVARPGQAGPGPWPGLDRKNTSASKFADMYTPPNGEGIGPERDIAADFGALDGRVAQWCLGGDLSCSAPKSISLARAALGIAAQSSLDFTHDPFGVAATLASATANTLATGAATFADKDIQGQNLADAYFAPGASISKRLEDASDPNNPDQQTNPLVGLMKMGQIVMSSVTSFIAQVFNPATLGSLLTAGVQIATSAATGAVAAGLPALAGGPAAAAAAAGAGAAAGATTALPSLTMPLISLAGSAATAALNVLPPQSADQKVSSVFDLLSNEIKANQDLPALLLDARLWNQQTTHGAYRSTRVAVDGSTPADITADWIIAAARDYHTAQSTAQNKDHDSTPATKNPAATSPVATYDRNPSGAVTAPVNDRPDLNAAAKTSTNGDVRLFTAPPAAVPPPSPAAAQAPPVTWLADGTAPLAQRLVARAAQDGPAASLLCSGSPLLAALTATIKEAQK